MMNVQLWSTLLKETAPNNAMEPHKVICYYSLLSRFVVLSEENYRSLNQAYGDRRIYKLSLGEIVSISKNIFAGKSAVVFNQGDVEVKIGRAPCFSEKMLDLVSREMNFSPAFTSQIINLIKEEEEREFSPSAEQEIVTALEKMSNRARDKHYQSEGIFGTAKLIGWMSLYDKTEEIAKIKSECKYSTPGQLDVQKVKKTLKMVCDTIRCRIAMNMNFFEKGIGLENGQLSFPNGIIPTREVDWEAFNAPCKVRRLWLKKYGQDNFHRNLVARMTKVWGQLMYLRQIIRE